MTTKYDVTITKGAILHEESTILLQCFTQHDNWENTRDEVVKRNLFHKESKKTITTHFGLLKKRLLNLTPKETELYPTLSFQQQNYILWLACCRTHPILPDFCIEVLQPVLASKESKITPIHFLSFYQYKCLQIPKLTTLTENTQTKIRYSTFTMLRQVGMLDKHNTILYTTLSPQLIELIRENNPEEFQWFTLPPNFLERNRKDTP